MERALKSVGLLAMAVLISFAGLACKPQKAEQPKTEPTKVEPDKTTPAQPTPDQPVTPDAQKPPVKPPAQAQATKVIPPEQYWDIHFQRMEILKKYLAQRVEVYEQYGSTSEEARTKLKEITTAQQQEMQQVWTSNGISPRDFYPRGGADATEVKQAREQYLNEHPELMEKMRSTTQELQKLRQQMAPYMGRRGGRRGAMGGPHGRMRAPGGGLPPGHPPVEGTKMIPPPTPAPTPEAAPAPTAGETPATGTEGQ